MNRRHVAAATILLIIAAGALASCKSHSHRADIQFAEMQTSRGESNGTARPSPRHSSYSPNQPDQAGEDSHAMAGPTRTPLTLKARTWTAEAHPAQRDSTPPPGGRRQPVIVRHRNAPARLETDGSRRRLSKRGRPQRAADRTRLPDPRHPRFEPLRALHGARASAELDHADSGHPVAARPRP